MAEKLNDRWQIRDFPVLLEAARRVDAGEPVVESRSIADALAMDPSEVARVLDGLHPTYVNGKAHSGFGTGVFMFVVSGLTDRGRRATGLWPDEEATADALVELLTQAADHVEDDEDASTLRKAGRMLRGVPAAVLADVTAALIRQQTGL